MTNGNEPAFATPAQFDVHTNVLREESPGLTKREYFAGQAMEGELSQMAAGIWADEQLAAAASQWVRIADALIAALNTTKQQDNG